MSECCEMDLHLTSTEYPLILVVEECFSDDRGRIFNQELSFVDEDEAQ